MQNMQLVADEQSLSTRNLPALSEAKLHVLDLLLFNDGLGPYQHFDSYSGQSVINTLLANHLEATWPNPSTSHGCTFLSNPLLKKDEILLLDTSIFYCHLVELLQILPIHLMV